MLMQLACSANYGEDAGVLDNDDYSVHWLCWWLIAYRLGNISAKN